jgi:hypothetical protein
MGGRIRMEFMVAFRGEHALNNIGEHNHEALLIMSEINKPGKSGIPLLRWIKEAY